MPTSATTALALALLSVASGCMDILSYVLLGQVFTSAMTGNAALLGLDIGQGNLAAMSRNLAAFLGFLAGLVLGALLLRRARGPSGHLSHVRGTLLFEKSLLIGFVALWHLGAGPSSDGMLFGLIGLSAVAMGVQSVVAHRLGVPGVTTTYFTGTITNIVVNVVGDGVTPRRPGRIGWPALSFLAYIAGAALTGFSLLPNTPALMLSPGLGLPMLPAVLVAVVLLISLLHRSGRASHAPSAFSSKAGENSDVARR